MKAMRQKSRAEKFWVGLLIFLALSALAACQPQVQGTPLLPVDLTPTLATSEWVVGEQRIVFGLLSPEQRLVSGANVTLEFFYQEAGTNESRGSTQAAALDLGIGDVEETLHETVPPLYLAYFNFDKPGLWGIKFSATHPDYQPSESGRQILVVEDPPTPGVGEPAIPSQNPILQAGADIATLTSDPNPDSALYAISIADAIPSGRPTVLNFSTPGFCTSRTCGPVLEVVKALRQSYGDRANFIHIEIYDDTPPDLAAGVEEWGLRSEPWTFVINAQGIITARFESLVSYQELEQAVLAAMGG